jgi:hypothetical protein
MILRVAGNPSPTIAVMSKQPDESPVVQNHSPIEVDHDITFKVESKVDALATPKGFSH